MFRVVGGISFVLGFPGVTECSGDLSRVWKLCRTYFGEVEAGQERSGVSRNLGLRGGGSAYVQPFTGLRAIFCIE